MKSVILGKRHMAGLVLFFAVLVTVCLLGTQQVILSAGNNLRSLPIYSVETQGQEKLVALGINCAWGANDIPEILKTLDQYDVKATFFLVGSFVKQYPEAVNEIFKAGHEIGNHSNTHADFATLTEEQIQAEVKDCNDKIEAVTGNSPVLVRCPSGSYNNLAIDTIRKMGCDPIQWSVDSLDWKGKTPAEMEERILPKLTYGDILLFHNDTKYTAKALPGLIQKIQQKGYRFVPVGELIIPGNDSIDPNGRQQRS